MKIIVDTSVLVGEILRKQGLKLLLSPEIDYFQPEYAFGEVRYEIGRRADWLRSTGKLSGDQLQDLLGLTFPLVLSRIRYLPLTDYAPFEAVARRRIPRDPNDWTLFVATALALENAAILTRDGDFLGCGLPTWTPETLRGELGI